MSFSFTCSFSYLSKNLSLEKFLFSLEKTQYFHYIMDMTKFFHGMKQHLSDQSKEQTQDDPKIVRGESQRKSFVDGFFISLLLVFFWSRTR